MELAQAIDLDISRRVAAVGGAGGADLAVARAARIDWESVSAAEGAPNLLAIMAGRIGYFEQTWSVATVAGEQYDRDLILEIQPEQKRREEAVFKTEKRWYSRWWVWTLAAVGASGVAAAIVTPIVLSRRSDCDKLDGEVCFPISVMPASLQLGLTIPLK